MTRFAAFSDFRTKSKKLHFPQFFLFVSSITDPLTFKSYDFLYNSKSPFHPTSDSKGGQPALHMSRSCNRTKPFLPTVKKVCIYVSLYCIYCVLYHMYCIADCIICSVSFKQSGRCHLHSQVDLQRVLFFAANTTIYMEYKIMMSLNISA